MKILLVEDDNGIISIESDYLMAAGYEVAKVMDGAKAQSIISKSINDFNLVVLDINLPKVNGIDLCKQIRRSSSIPIIMVTAKTKEQDELLGLELGASDYLKKPFSPRVLVARVNTLLKRNEQERKRLVVGEFSLVDDKRRAYKDSVEIKLTNLQYQLLKAFMNNPGVVLTRNQLIDMSSTEAIVPDVLDRTIDSHIKNLRKKIEADSKKPKFIRTIRGRGYVFYENY